MTSQKLSIQINNHNMELKSWLLAVRILNCSCAFLLVGFQIWFLVDLFQEDRSFYGYILRIWAPAFISLVALILLLTEFEYSKMVEYFKFLQILPGIALFNLFMASIVAFQFSVVDDTLSIVSASLFLALAIAFFIFHFLKPQGQKGLLSLEKQPHDQ